MAGPAAGWWPVLPALPANDQVRAVLAGWAGRQLLVPTNLFDGPLSVSDASVVRMEVDRLVETRTETTVSVAGRHPQVGTYDDLWSHHLDGDEWQERDWRGVRRGSVRIGNCTACLGRASVPCPTCQGLRLISCPKTLPCERCRRTGWVDVRQGPPVTCPNCRGSATLRCRRCMGTGKRRCPNRSCAGGRVRCGGCEATGSVTRHRAGRIHRAIRQDVVRAGDGEPAVGAADDDLYRPVLTTEAAPDLSALPEPLRRKLDGELARRLADERRRRVRLAVLPVVAVEYRDGENLRTAYLVGPDQRVHAPGAKRLRWRLRIPW